MKHYKLFILSLCTIGLSAGAMSLDKSGEDKASILNQDEIIEQLFDAIRRDRLEDVRKLIPAQISVDVKYNIGWTPLMLAANRAEFAIVQYLVECRADLDFKDNNGHTPLLLAANSVDGLPCADLIVEAMLGLTPSQKDKICYTAFCMRNATKNTALPECELPVVERLCQEFYAENKEKTLKGVNRIWALGIREYLLKKYFPEYKNN